MNISKIIEDLEKINLNKMDIDFLVGCLNQKEYITTTEFIKCHHLFYDNKLLKDSFYELWLLLFHKSYQYKIGILYLLLNKPVSNRISKFEYFKYFFLAVIDKKKDAPFLNCLIQAILIKIGNLFYWLELRLLIYFNNKKLLIGKDFTKGNFTKFYLDRFDTKIIIGSNVKIRSFCIFRVDEGGKLNIEDNVFINNYCSFTALDCISIGENTMIGEGVKIYDHNHWYKISENNNIEISPNEFTKQAVKIGNNCWIGSNVTILKGVEIGNNVIIGANNLIYKSVPSNTILKYNPRN